MVATALTLEFGRTLVVDSLGETDVVETLASSLRAIWILLVVGGVFVAGYRWYARRHDGEQLDRIRALLDSLDEPEAELDGLAPHTPHLAPPIDSARNPDQAAVLQRLPVGRYDGAMLLAVTAALADAETSLRAPGTPEPAFGTATELLDQLLHDRILAVCGAHYHPTVPRPRSESDEVLTTTAWAAALHTLVREHAERASTRALALGHPDHGAAARAWFVGAESELRELVTGACSSARLPSAVLPELIRIIDALDVYYGHDSRTALLRTLINGRSETENYPLHRALLTLRANPAADVQENQRPLAWSTAVAARRRHGRALHRFHSDGDPDKVARRLERVWRLLPRADLTAEVCVLINLAVVEIRRDRLEAAGDRLELALARTENGRDPGGRVHATEILGILHWKLGDLAAALRYWRTAWTGYLALADERGQGRCLRHLGSALRANPALGGVAVAPEPGQPLHHALVLRQADGWLAAADFLDPGNSAAPPSRMGPPWPPMDRPPLELPDQHLRIARRPDSA
ncbi:hypothetical protein [Nocardia harenae]|uniref:hypothetical protein n=1 Tax=Nocardia harenae TaxID=358707 RepID=UPI0008300D82|nr:hypothetical protein [Nocardia harenae]